MEKRKLINETLNTVLLKHSGKNCYVIELLDFHSSLEMISKEVKLYSYIQLEDILHINIPDKVTVILPAPLDLDKWFCITKETAISYKVSLIEKASLVNVIPSGSKVVVLLNTSYENSK